MIKQNLFVAALEVQTSTRDHEEVVEADDEAIFNEIVPVTPRDMIINMKVEPDSPVVQEQKQPVSHTMHFN